MIRFGRRALLSAGGALAALGLGGATALWRFGPRHEPGYGWGAGVRLLDGDGNPIRPEDIPPGGILTTVWPARQGRRERAAALVLRLTDPPDDPDLVDGDILAYSRICTHAGCPVGLFRAEEGMLYCPCHQATYDAADGARPVFGPASRALPRLPLDVDGDGFLVAAGDFTGRPGPGAERS